CVVQPAEVFLAVMLILKCTGHGRSNLVGVSNYGERIHHAKGQCAIGANIDEPKVVDAQGGRVLERRGQPAANNQTIFLLGNAQRSIDVPDPTIKQKLFAFALRRYARRGRDLWGSRPYVVRRLRSRPVTANGEAFPSQAADVLASEMTENEFA